MNAPRLVAALAGALLASTSYAFEATQFVDPPSAWSRADAAAAAADAVPLAEATVLGDATQFVDKPQGPLLTRDEVMREAALTPGHHAMVDCPHYGG
jgi:hypothetical protein